jgi:hypothetical protein
MKAAPLAYDGLSVCPSRSRHGRQGDSERAVAANVRLWHEASLADPHAAPALSSCPLPQRAGVLSTPFEGTYLAADTCRIAKKPEPPKPIIWNLYKIARMAVWLGTVEAPAGVDPLQQPIGQFLDQRDASASQKSNGPGITCQGQLRPLTAGGAWGWQAATGQ